MEAMQRALALFQALGNLHCFSPTSSVPELRHRFVRLLAAELHRMPPVGASALFKLCPPKLPAVAVCLLAAGLHRLPLSSALHFFADLCTSCSHWLSACSSSTCAACNPWIRLQSSNTSLPGKLDSHAEHL